MLRLCATTSSPVVLPTASSANQQRCQPTALPSPDVIRYSFKPSTPQKAQSHTFQPLMRRVGLRPWDPQERPLSRPASGKSFHLTWTLRWSQEVGPFLLFLFRSIQPTNQPWLIAWHLLLPLLLILILPFLNRKTLLMLTDTAPPVL